MFLNLLERFTELRATLTFTSLLKDMNQQSDEEIRRARSEERARSFVPSPAGMSLFPGPAGFLGRPAHAGLTKSLAVG